MRRRRLWIGVLGLVIVSIFFAGVQTHLRSSAYVETSADRSRFGGQEAFTQPPKPKACIVDIDGTIDGSTNWRRYFDPELVKQDKPVLKSREALKWVEQQGIKIFYVSNRETIILEATKWWLREHSFPEGEVYHRKPFARSLKYKIDTIRTIQKSYDVIFGVGDRDRDIIAYQTCGIAAIKVAKSSEEDWVRVENEIAKLLK